MQQYRKDIKVFQNNFTDNKLSVIVPHWCISVERTVPEFIIEGNTFVIFYASSAANEGEENEKHD
jgi:hypothetical protein